MNAAVNQTEVKWVILEKEKKRKKGKQHAKTKK